MKKKVNGKKPAGNQAAKKTGRQTSAAAASPNKSNNKLRSKSSAKKPIEKKSVSKNPIERKQADTGQKPVNKKCTAKKKLFKKRVPAARTSSSANSTVRPAAGKNPAKPVDKRSRRAADKATRNKQAAVKRHRYHGGNYILYYILAGMIVITVLVILANTVLFRCKSITVTGNTRYTAEEIISSSGIETGMNLLHINKANAASKIEAGLAYIDSAEVKKSFPTGIEISVVEAQRWFSVRQGSITAAVSRGGKIVEHGEFDDLPLVLGMEAESVEVGARLKSTVEGKNDIPALILSAIESAALENVDEVDISDRFSIKMKLDNGRIILELGTSSDMESKLKVAKVMIVNQIGTTESVTIIINNPTMASVRPITSDISGDPVNSNDSNGQSSSNDSQSSTVE